jgi:hypothetical protein
LRRSPKPVGAQEFVVLAESVVVIGRCRRAHMASVSRRYLRTVRIFRAARGFLHRQSTLRGPQ